MSFEASQSGGSVPVVLSLVSSTPPGDITLVSPTQTTVDATNVTSATLIVTNPSTRPMAGLAFFVFGEVRVEIDTTAAQFQVEGKAFVNGSNVNDQANHNYPVQKAGSTTLALIKLDQNAPVFPYPITIAPGGSVTLLLRMDYNYIGGTPRDVTIQQSYIAFMGVA